MMASLGTPCARELGSGHGGLVLGCDVGGLRKKSRRGLQRAGASGGRVVAKVASGTRTGSVAAGTTVVKLPDSQRIALNRLIQPSSMSSGAMEELELERGVCNPFRKYTPERVSV